MLAYIFLHAPYADIDVSEYEKALLVFQRRPHGRSACGNSRRPRPIKSPKCLG